MSSAQVLVAIVASIIAASVGLTSIARFIFSAGKKAGGRDRGEVEARQTSRDAILETRADVKDMRGKVEGIATSMAETLPLIKHQIEDHEKRITALEGRAT